MTVDYSRVKQRWLELQTDLSENDLEHQLLPHIWEALSLNVQQVKYGCSLGAGSGLKPDVVVYKNLNDASPTLVVEIKKRTSAFAKQPEETFADWCKTQPLYRNAVGYQDGPGNNNGILQYLNVNKVKSAEYQASYGWVFNGDFFQLWRRVDGLVLPLTPIQKVTEGNLEKLMQQLEHCLQKPPRALVTAIWNQKGGVAKTTNTINLGAELAKQGKKVLLVDLDSQADLTRSLGLEDKVKLPDFWEQYTTAFQMKDSSSMVKLLSDGISVRKFPTTDGQKFELSILPAEHFKLKDFQMTSEGLPDQFKRRAIRDVMHRLSSYYDYIFTDLSPTTNVLTTGLLVACDTILIPVDYSRKSLYHAAEVMQSIPSWRNARIREGKVPVGPWNLGLVFSNCPGEKANSLDGVINAELKKLSFSRMPYKTELKIYSQTKMAEFRQCPVVCWEASPITKLYKKLAHEVFINHNFIDH